MQTKKRKSDEQIPNSKRTKRCIYIYPDIVSIVLSFLSPRDICSASLVCKEWFKVTQQDCLWRQLFYARFDGKLFRDFDYSKPYREQYKMAVKRLYRRTPIVDCKSPFDEKTWSSLTLRQKEEKIEEYFSAALDHLYKENFLEALKKLLSTSFIIDHLLAIDPRFNLKVVSCLHKIERTELYCEMGYATLALRELDLAIDQFQQLIRERESNNAEGASILQQISSSICATAAIAANLLQSYDHVCIASEHAYNVIENAIKLSSNTLEKLRFAKRMAILAAFHIKALHKKGNWTKLAETVILHLENAMRSYNLCKDSDCELERDEYDYIYNIYSCTFLEMAKKWKRKKNMMWVNKVKGNSKSLLEHFFEYQK